MISLLRIGDSIKYAILDLLRFIGMGFVNIIYDTIDVLYNVANKINSLNFIQMLQNIDNSPFTKIFNAFFILAFIVLFLFSVWKITFRILDADINDQPLFELVKEILKCGILIFSIYMIFNTTINIGINLSSAIYNNFTENDSTIGTKMKSAYLTINESCYKETNNEDTDKKNVEKLQKSLGSYLKNNVSTMEDFENLIRNETLTATDVTDSGAFSFRCNIYKPGIFNDSEDYAFSYNFLFGILVGIIFLFAIGFAVLMLGRRQLELAFLMVISPLVIATSVGRREQRSALYQQLASLVLQAGALMLLIGLTSVMFNVIQNSADINNLNYFTKIVTQSILYLGCAMMLLTGCTSLNRFIGENVSANSGRDMMMALHGLMGGIATAGHLGTGLARTGISSIRGVKKSGVGLGRIAKGGTQMAKGFYHKVASSFSRTHSGISRSMNSRASKGVAQVMKGSNLQESRNPFSKLYGKTLEKQGMSNINNAKSKWDFSNDTYNKDYLRSGFSTVKEGLRNIKDGVGGTFNSIRSIGGSRYRRYNPRNYYYNDSKKK